MPTMPPTPLAKIISHARTAYWTLHNKHTQLCTILSYSCCYYSTSLPSIPSPTWDKKKYFTAHQICSQVFHNVQNYSSYCTCHLFRKQLGLQLLLRGHLPRLVAAPMSAAISQIGISMQSAPGGVWSLLTLPDLTEVQITQANSSKFLFCEVSWLCDPFVQPFGNYPQR